MKRIHMESRLVRQEDSARHACRTVRLSDRHNLSILLYAAFRGTIDDEGERLADARAEIDRTFTGKYGRLLPDCSFVYQEEELLLSACLISCSEPDRIPLVVFSMTHPQAQRQGLARLLLRRSINALLDRGYKQLQLVVTDGNSPAQHLYASLGFRPIDRS